MIRRHRYRPAFTLAETLAALGISSVLLVASGSVVVISSRSIPKPNDAATVALTNQRAFDRLSDDLRFATSIDAVTVTGLSLRIPDRDADGSDESVAYSWSGTRGETLLRSENAGDTVAVGPGLKDLAFSLRTTSTTSTQPHGYATSANLYLAGHDTMYTGTMPIRSNAGYSVTFRVTPPDSSGVAFNLSRLELPITKSLLAITGQKLTVELRVANADGTPTDQIIASDSRSASLLSDILSLTWPTFFASGVSGLDPNQTYAIVMYSDSASDSFSISYADDVQVVGSRCASSSGSGWTVLSSRLPFFRVYGTVTGDGSQTSTQPLAQSITLNATPNSGTGTAHSRTFVIPSTPAYGAPAVALASGTTTTPPVLSGPGTVVAGAFGSGTSGTGTSGTLSSLVSGTTSLLNGNGNKKAN
ncbi:MAG: type II secretion system protein J [Phycisphaerales bacterium]